MSKQKVVVFTSTRADYGIFRPLLERLSKHKSFDVSLIVTGTHLSPLHGLTISEIDADGYPISAIINVWSESDSPIDQSQGLSKAMNNFSIALNELRPDLLIILGDRLEVLAIATCALILDIPIAHIHGGEITRGAMDDKIRHAITKIATIHFPATKEFAIRIEQLGEPPASIHNVGALAMDNISNTKFLDRKELSLLHSTVFDGQYCLLTFHPNIYEEVPSDQALENTLEAILEYTNLMIIVTGTNNDIGSNSLNQVYSKFLLKNSGRMAFVKSLGMIGYLSAIRHASLVAGNTSSILIETPPFGVPALLIGNRQEGRPISSNITTSTPHKIDLVRHLNELEDQISQIRPFKDIEPAYGLPGAADKICKVLEQINWPISTYKGFVDHEFLMESTHG